MTSKYRPTDGLADLLRRILANRIGPERALTRADLLGLIHSNPIYTGVNDKQLRAAIGDLREGGALICNQADGDGYFLAGTMADYQDFRAMYVSYARTIEARVRRLDQAAEELFKSSPAQERMF